MAALLLLTATGCGASSASSDGPIPGVQGLIAFQCLNCGAPLASEIWVVHADGQRLRQLIGPGTYYTPSLSPDGRRIAFEIGGGGLDALSGPLTVMNTSGVVLQQVASVRAEGPSWSPDGKKLAYYDDELRGLYTINADGSGAKRLTNLVGCCPAWSPDGKKIVYAGYSGQEFKTPDEIFVINADGQGRRLLAHSSAGDRDPVWSPDGKTIAYLHGGGENCFGSNAIYLINADGSHQRRLTGDSPVANACLPTRQLAWAPGGKALAFASGNDLGGIVVMSADGKARRWVPGTKRFFIESLSWQPLPSRG